MVSADSIAEEGSVETAAHQAESESRPIARRSEPVVTAVVAVVAVVDVVDVPIGAEAAAEGRLEGVA
jgi:hypothetical protein